MKKILTVASTIALAVAGFTSISSPESASAVTPTSNLFSLNVANQNSGSGPKNFYELGGKTYFVASTLSKATSLWRVDGDITKEPEFLFDPFDGPISGRIEHLWGYGDFLFFWVQDTTNYSSNTPYVLNVVTKEVKQIRDADGNVTMLSYETPGYFSESNGVIYGFAKGNRNLPANITTFNPVDMTVSTITTTPIVPASTGVSDNLVSPWTYPAAFYALGNYLYISNNVNTYNDNRLYRYNLTTSEWSGALQRNGAEISGIRLHGEFTYNGEKGLIFSEPIQKATGWNTSYKFESFFVKADGSINQIGNWNFQEERMAFVNYKGDLYASYWYGAEFYKIDAVTGERTDVYQTMFPGLSTRPAVRTVKQVGDKLLLIINMLGNQQGQFLLYGWDGVGAATRFTNVNPGTGQSDINQSASNSNAGTNFGIGSVGNYAILTLNRDSTIGAEPYYLSLDGTLTLMKDMNRASDGSAPDTSCFISTPDGDWMTGNLPIDAGKSVIVSMKPEGSFLKYSIIGVGDLMQPCGFAFVGEDIFFTARSMPDYMTGVYKRSPDGTITKMTDVVSGYTGEKAISYGGNYYWLANNWYHQDLYKYDVAANTVTKLTGKDGDLIAEDSAKDMLLIGSKLVLIGGDNRYSPHKIFIADLAEPEFTLTNVTPEGEAESGLFYPDNLMNFQGKAIFTSSMSDRTNDVLEVRLDTNEVVKLFDIDPDGTRDSYARDMFQVGSKLYIPYGQGNSVLLKRWSSGSMAITSPLAAEFRLQCAAPAGGDIVVQDIDGKAFYYGNGFNMKPIDYNFSGNTSAFCNSAPASHGTYLSLPEYPYDQSGIGFGTEPGYIGPLTPIAVSRLGEEVTEAPSVPLSSNTPSETTPAAPGTPGTPVATTGAGKVSLVWDAPTSGGEVSRYLVESNPAGAQCEIVGTSAECIGLTEGTQYTFTVTATNAGGLTTSAASNSATPGPAPLAPGKPGAPTGTGFDGGVDISWTAPTDGGEVDSYIVQSSPA